MNATTKQENTLTDREQSAITILEEIANDANSLRRALLDMEFEGTSISTQALPLFRVFAEKIGWMAEEGVKRAGGKGLIVGDAEDWLLSPMARDAIKGTVEPTDQPTDDDENREYVPTTEDVGAMLEGMNESQLRRFVDVAMAALSKR